MQPTAGRKVRSAVESREVAARAALWERGSSQVLHLQAEERYARSLMRLKHPEVAASVMSALDHIDISLERSILWPPRHVLTTLWAGRPSFRGLSGVYCKQRRSCSDLAFWLCDRGCLTAVSKTAKTRLLFPACAWNRWIMQAGKAEERFHLPPGCCHVT